MESYDKKVMISIIFALLVLALTCMVFLYNQSSGEVHNISDLYDRLNHWECFNKENIKVDCNSDNVYYKKRTAYAFSVPIPLP